MEKINIIIDELYVLKLEQLIPLLQLASNVHRWSNNHIYNEKFQCWQMGKKKVTHFSQTILNHLNRTKNESDSQGASTTKA